MLTRVWIVAATPALRAGLRSLLTSETIQIVGESPTWPTPLADPSLIDVGVIDSDGADVEPSELPRTRVVLSDEQASRQIAPGVAHLPLAVSGPMLIAAAHAVAQGLAVISAAPHQIEAREEPAEPLSAREREVLELAGRGLPSKMIASALEISESTVKFHLSSVYAKLGVASRVEAVSKAARFGLITL